MKKTKEQRLLEYLQTNGFITIGTAESELGLPRKKFYDAIYRLRAKGFYIVIHRNRTDILLTTYVLGTEEDRTSDSKRPHYSYSDNRRLWDIWKHMRERCDWSGHKSYYAYGGRGIRVCDEWEESFQAFAEWAYANGYNDDAQYMECTIDRIDNNGDYEPSNCRWITMKEQCNNRRSNKLITSNGITKTLSAWANETRIPSDTIARRLKRGWSAEKALNTPVKKRKDNRCNAWIASAKD